MVAFCYEIRANTNLAGKLPRSPFQGIIAPLESNPRRRNALYLDAGAFATAIGAARHDLRSSRLLFEAYDRPHRKYDISSRRTSRHKL
jgi:hypothetical protein